MSTTDTLDQVLERIPLADVLVDVNVRTDIHLDKPFVASIKAHGILQPPIGWRGEDGKVRITAGQRRTLAAMQLELDSIDVILKPQEIAEAARVVTQLIENDQRQELTESERVFGYKQLAMFGVSADQISRRTNRPKAQVQQALAIAESEIATDALQSLPVTLEQAALLVEFEDDAEAVDRLLQVASTAPHALGHEAQRMRDAAAYRAAKAAAEAELVAKGIEILDESPAYNDNTTVNIRSLWRAGDEKHTPLEVTDLDGLSGVLARVHQPGWHEAQEGALIATSYYVRRWNEQGLETHSWTQPKSEADLAKEKATKKAERQLAADLRSATTVRREWIRATLLARKVDVASAAPLIAASLVGADTAASDARVYPIAAELLGIQYDVPAKGSYDNKSRAAVVAALQGDADALRLALGVAIARTESVIGDPAAWPSARDSKTTIAYYLQLEQWGYTLSEVEASIAHPKKRRGAKA
jgi:ParB family chromosome partitioning protein